MKVIVDIDKECYEYIKRYGALTALEEALMDGEIIEGKPKKADIIEFGRRNLSSKW